MNRQHSIFESREDKMMKLWEYMVDNGIVTDSEVGVACHFNGKSLETMESLLYYKTGYQSLDQLEDELDEWESMDDGNC